MSDGSQRWVRFKHHHVVPEDEREGRWNAAVDTIVKVVNRFPHNKADVFELKRFVNSRAYAYALTYPLSPHCRRHVLRGDELLRQFRLTRYSPSDVLQAIVMVNKSIHDNGICSEKSLSLSDEIATYARHQNVLPASSPEPPNPDLWKAVCDAVVDTTFV
jgi:hypothetical protein